VKSERRDTSRRRRRIRRIRGSSSSARREEEVATDRDRIETRKENLRFRRRRVGIR